MPKIKLFSLLSLLMFLYGVAIVQAQVTKETVAYYSFDNVVGKAVPSLTAQFDGKLEGNASVVFEKVQGNALKIGDCKDYMVVENFGFEDIPDGTLELWVKMLKPSQCGRQDAGEWSVIANFGGNFGANADALSLGTAE